MNFLDVNNTFFTVFNYPMSYIEFFGTLFNLACVWLVARKNILNWPIGIIGVLLFGALFYQLNLYADLTEQFYYLITGFWGWYAWTKAKEDSDLQSEEITVRKLNSRHTKSLALGFLLMTAVGIWIMSNIHLWIPKFFPEPASMVAIDVATTVASFLAQFLMVKKYLENWMLWIAVDVIAIWLYWYKGVPLVSILYAIFLVLATKGFLTWRATYNQQKG